MERVIDRIHVVWFMSVGQESIQFTEFCAMTRWYGVERRGDRQTHLFVMGGRQYFSNIR